MSLLALFVAVLTALAARTLQVLVDVIGVSALGIAASGHDLITLGKRGIDDPRRNLVV